MITKRNLGRLAGGAACAVVAAPRAARAQGGDAAARGWPDRPVRIVVPYSPGGANDILARLYGQKLSDRFGQPFVVENRPGAQAIVGTEAVARARPDGYTLLMGASGPMVFNPATYERLPYDTLKDLAPVSMLASFPLVLIVSASSPFRTVQDLIGFAKANPDRANYGASGAGFQLPTELLNQRAGTRFVYVAYRGSADSTNAVANGEVTTTLVDAGPASVALEAGRVRALAVTAPRRLAAWPDVPTMAEAGFPDFEVALWSGFFAPAATPSAILGRLEEAAMGITREPDILERLKALSMDPVGGGSEEFRRVIAREIDFWRGVARTANVRLER
jgi:tripartite-type tricarboxylate transporter receptor subunit TctC